MPTRNRATAARATAGVISGPATNSPWRPSGTARGQVLRHEPRSGLPVSGDPRRLKQLVLILLDNALKYTPPGRAVELGLEGDGAEVRLVVRDEGAGIPPGDLPHVFERFYRADPARARDPGGTGLGLLDRPAARGPRLAHEHAGRGHPGGGGVCPGPGAS
ncbi:sensor histidine kinase [Deinococcus apachensis]|uniref:sensor histidine kinase n=1 Tax=Deinococcus apachensis TaxID=309886 RepID=UPI00146B93B7|nr:ATP-binding protein [Deinococcus apachensis]